MAIKCELCKEKVETTLLGKIKGTYVKKKVVCSKCQQKYGNKLKDMVK